MAAYTSTQSGNWNDAATWGGGGWPELAGDTATVSAGHTVTYNVAADVEMGAITTNGLWSFATNMSTKLTMSHNEITVGATGELRIGTSGAVLDKAYTAEIVWNTTSDNAKGIAIANGGKVTIYGDPAYYGSDDDTKLFANWTSGSSLTVVGDFSTKWASGQEIYIHKNDLYSNYLTDTFKGTISGAPTWDGTKTTITISEAHPGGTFNAGGWVVNVSRNIIISKVGVNTAIGQWNTNRPRITDANGASGNCVMQDCLVSGFYGISSTWGFDLSRSVFRNGDRLNVSRLTGDSTRVVSVLYGVGFSNYNLNLTNVKLFANVTNRSLSACYIHGEVYGNGTGLESVTESVIVGNFFSNSNAVGSLINGRMTGNFYNNVYVLNGAYYLGTLEGKIGYDESDNELKNTNDFNSNYAAKLLAQNVKISSNTFIRLRNTAIGYKGRFSFGNYNRTLGDIRVFTQYTDQYKNTVTVRSGGATASFEVVPLSYIASAFATELIVPWTENDVPASAQTRTIYIKGEGWTSFPTNTELYLEAEYFDHATNLTRTTAVSTAVLTDNTTWTAFTVSFTPAQVGRVDYRIYLKKYEAASKVYIDNALYNGTKMAEAQWVLGESQLMIDQDAWASSGVFCCID